MNNEPNNDNRHLDGNRKLILTRSLVAGAAGLVPVPYIDELLAGSVRGSLIRRLAEIRSVDVDANAVDALAHPHGSRILGAATFGAAALAGTRRAFRTVAASLLLVRRTDEAVQTFIVGTLFDHYCAKHHVGAGIDGYKAAEIRRAMDLASKKARNLLVERNFKRVLGATSRIMQKMPRRLFGTFGTPPAAPIPADVLPSLEQRIETAGYVLSLCSAFDDAWAAFAKPRPATPGPGGDPA
jgi:hypothetical protein